MVDYAGLLQRPIFAPDLSREALTCDGAIRSVRHDPFMLILDKSGMEPIELQTREPMKLDRVLVTGACGTIGSAIVSKLRGVAGRIYAADRDERALAGLDQSDSVTPCLLDVTHKQEVAERVHIWKPQLVIHAAAYKHVPFMEFYPAQAIENNFDGTRNVLDAVRFACPDSRFVFVSTDKAASRSTVMGCTKWLAEQYVCSCQSSSKRTLAIVRFGNVLGSSGSVIEIWERQLFEGKPLTVAYGASRYFCTIDEAAALAIQASTLVMHDPGATATATLNMGDPVPMTEMAKRFLALKGVPDHPVEHMGLRNGDQEHETLTDESEELQEVGSA